MLKKMFFLLVLLQLSLIISPALAQEVNIQPIVGEEKNEIGDEEVKPQNSVGESEIKVFEKEVKELTTSDELKKKLPLGSPDISGFGFGAGIGVNVHSEKAVDSAKIVNNIVRIENESNAKTQFWLEAHYNFGKQYKTYKCTAKKCLIYDIQEKSIATIDENEIYFRPKRVFHGPFFALNVSDSENVINGAALGWMVSLRKVNETETPTGRFFNLGLGVSTVRVQQLRGGLKHGQTVPEGTQIDYKNKDQVGILILFSVGL